MNANAATAGEGSESGGYYQLPLRNSPGSSLQRSRRA
jgi:hypothetical protein